MRNPLILHKVSVGISLTDVPFRTDSGFCELMDAQVETSRLILEPKSADSVRAMLDAMPPEDRAQVAQDWVDRALSATEADPFVHGYTIRLKPDGTAIGFCGFKGHADADGVVELAYFVEDDFRGRGFASEAAQGASQFALRSPGVRIVMAHTLPDHVVSQKVLTRCGFRYIRDEVVPDDGLVQRWELS